MATIKPSYRAVNQSITISLASLTNTSARASTYIDNTANLDDEVLFVLKVKSGGSSTAATGHVDIYFYGSADESTYPEGITGSDAGVTLTVPTNLGLPRALNVVANSTTYESEPIPVSPFFGGVIPPYWGVVVVNNSGGTLDSTEGNHAKFFAGIQFTVA